MTKHTPSPWSRTPPPDSGEWRGTLNIYDGDGSVIASVWDREGVPVDKKGANACLMAAAPDMLDTIYWIKADIDEDRFPSQSTVDKVNEIISKVEGETNG